MNATKFNANNGSAFVLSAVCRNCTHWSNPPLDLTSTTAPFMWAVGQNSGGTGARWSNAPNAPLRSHSIYATFTMNMQQATVSTNPNSDLPDLGNVTNGANGGTRVVTTHDLLSPLHGVAMIIALVIFIPIGALLRTCFKSVKFHLVIVGFVTAFFIIGIVVAFSLSSQFNRVSWLRCKWDHRLTLFSRVNHTTAPIKS
jgi:hypothetical protein